jgi:hypothetical protein
LVPHRDEFGRTPRPAFGPYFLLSFPSYQYGDLRLGKLTRHIHNEIRLCFYRISQPMAVSIKTPAMEQFHVSDSGVLTRPEDLSGFERIAETIEERLGHNKQH